MTGPEHYEAAEALLDHAAEADRSLHESGRADANPDSLRFQASVHAQLAIAAAYAMSHWNGQEMPMPQPDRLAWEKVASERPAAQAAEKARRVEEAREFGMEV